MNRFRYKKPIMSKEEQRKFEEELDQKCGKYSLYFTIVMLIVIIII